MTFTSYAQNFEDVLLWRALHDVQQGRYIDIGAHDPVVDSVSLAFYNAGWRGLHVEPIPNYAARLRDARPEEAVIEAAVSDEVGPILFYELDGLSSGRRDVAEHHASFGHVARQMFVPTVRLDQLLKMVNSEVHWLKIDVEGMEADVLRSWRDSEVRPWILVIEATFPNSQGPTQHLWIDEVLQRGYERVFFDGLSCYFLHEGHRELADRFTAPANYFDKFVVATHHSTVADIRAALGGAQQRLGEEQAHAQQLTADLEAAVQASSSARQALSQREAEAADARVQIARFEERCVQLQHMLDRAKRDNQESIEASRRDHHAAESELRRAFAEGERSLRQVLEQAITNEASAQVELARLDERAAYLRLRLDAAEQETEIQRNEALRLHDEIEQSRRDVMNAGLLIRNAVGDRLGFWARLGLLFGIAGPRRAWRELAAWSHSVNTAISETRTNEMNARKPSSSQFEGRNPYLRANSLPELLSWHDVNFVRCAYVTILGRQPDPSGEAYYTDRVRRGHSKLEVLWQLRKSEEGPNHDPGISGLDRALKRAAWLRRPVLGWSARLFRQRSCENDSIMLLRSVSNEQFSLTAKLDDALAAILRRLDQVESARPSRNAEIPTNKRRLHDPIHLEASLDADQKIELLKQAINASQESASLRQ